MDFPIKTKGVIKHISSLVISLKFFSLIECEKLEISSKIVVKIFGVGFT